MDVELELTMRNLTRTSPSPPTLDTELHPSRHHADSSPTLIFLALKRPRDADVRPLPRGAHRRPVALYSRRAGSRTRTGLVLFVCNDTSAR